MLAFARNLSSKSQMIIRFKCHAIKYLMNIWTVVECPSYIHMCSHSFICFRVKCDIDVILWYSRNCFYFNSQSPIKIQNLKKWKKFVLMGGSIFPLLYSDRKIIFQTTLSTCVDEFLAIIPIVLYIVWIVNKEDLLL